MKRKEMKSSCFLAMQPNASCQTVAPPELYSNTAYLVFAYVSLIIIEVFGNGLLLLMHIYEKYGVDSLKRTVMNQLASQMCFWILLSNILILPLGTYYMTTLPPLEGQASTTRLYFSQLIIGSVSSMYMLCGLCFCEGLALKCLYVIKYSSYAMTDESFIAIFLGMFNTLFVVSSSFVRWFLGELEANVHVHFLAGHEIPNRNEFHQKIMLVTTLLPWAVILIGSTISFVVITYRRKRIFQVEQPDGEAYVSHHYNTQANENMISVAGYVFCVAFLSLSILPKIVQNTFGLCFGPIFSAYSYLMVFWITSPILPSLFFLRKPSRFKIAIEHLPCFN